MSSYTPSDWSHFYQQQQQQQPNTSITTTHSTAPSSSTTPLTPEGRVSKPIRRRSRASRRTPTTLLNTDTTNFRAMVQQFTGGGPTPLLNHVPPPQPPFRLTQHQNLSLPYQPWMMSLNNTPDANHMGFLHSPDAFNVVSTSSTSSAAGPPGRSSNGTNDNRADTTFMF